MSEVAEQLLEVLASLDEASQFCTSGSVAPILPGLEVQGVGEIGLPIGPAAARQLIQQATPAPYGRGEETEGPLLSGADASTIRQKISRQESVSAAARTLPQCLTSPDQNTGASPDRLGPRYQD